MWLGSVSEVRFLLISIHVRILFSDVQLNNSVLFFCLFFFIYFISRQDLFVILRDFSGLVQVLIPQDEVVKINRPLNLSMSDGSRLLLADGGPCSMSSPCALVLGLSGN